MYHKPLNSILVKPTGAECNIDCEYCFYLQKASLYPSTQHPRMTDEVLEAMITQMMTQSMGDTSFGWQGGEPTLMGLDFFKRAIELQKKLGRDGQNVGNGLQTNGILLNQDWVKFFKEFNWLIGLSMDGPEHVHDHYRRTRNDKATHHMVKERAQMLLEGGVAVNALIVANDYSAEHGKEIYEYHKVLGFEHLQFIPCIEPDGKGGIAPFSVSPKQYGKLLCDVFDCWLGDFKNGYPTTSIRMYDALFHTYVSISAPMCTMAAECGSYVCVEHNGNVYSCDFYVDDDWLLGNVLDSTLDEMLNSELQMKFGQQKSKLHPKCQKCQWITKCYGNCPKERTIGGRNVDELNYFCESYMALFEHSDATFKRLATKWQEDQRRQQVMASIPKEAFENIQRNDPCPCGSGKKFKKCCGVGA
jgi:uncharacterized protein